ncbi:serine--tRNA ligase [Gammaproteobacteria bacterium]|nr:serine--tRNA ligase [Gammaproteobacteria bacterium]
MNDPQLFSAEHLSSTTDNLASRGYILDTQKLFELTDRKKMHQQEMEALQMERNRLSKDIANKIKTSDVSDLKDQVAQINTQITALTQSVTQSKEDLEQFYLDIPNLLDASVCYGESDADNPVIKTVGAPRTFDFKPKDHVDLGQDLNGINFTDAAKMSGSRFVILQGNIARLNRALSAFMLDTHVNRGYTEVNVPQLVKSHAMVGTGQLPKFSDDQFTLERDDLSLIPTAEVPVTNMVRDSILSDKELPKKFVALTSCFRREAGAYGKDTRGMIRLHQFEKVELVKIVRPEEGANELEQLLADAENILSLLQLPYRVVSLCSKDTGFSAQKTYDIEVFLPSQNTYREISSCSHFGTFQARRMQARFRDPNHKKPQLVHTLNGSGLAVGRTLLAIIENYQQEDGSIQVPEALIPYMGGMTAIMK